jgi:hypothetical protein
MAPASRVVALALIVALVRCNLAAAAGGEEGVLASLLRESKAIAPWTVEVCVVWVLGSLSLH